MERGGDVDPKISTEKRGRIGKEEIRLSLSLPERSQKERLAEKIGKKEQKKAKDNKNTHTPLAKGTAYGYFTEFTTVIMLRVALFSHKLRYWSN